MSKSVGKGMKIVSVILGTLMAGFMWRCRGESGFGSSWGLYSVALILMLLIYNFYGKRKGMRFEMIPLGAFLMGLGVTGYATVIEQMSGVLESDLPYDGQELVSLPINPFSGMAIILIMGFTLIPFFSLFIGSLFSDKEYKLKHYITVVVIFFVVSLIAKATVAPYIVTLINPEQTHYAALGLADSGYEYASPIQAYLKHFLNRSWTQEIPFFENFYMSVEHVSDAIAVIAITIYTAVVRKDKVTTLVSLGMNIFTSIATTAFSLMIIAYADTGFAAYLDCPRCLEIGAGWGIWEYATGASVGFCTMLAIALLPKKYTEQNDVDMSPLIKNETANCVFNIILFIFIFGVTPFRVIGIRINRVLHYYILHLEEKTAYGEIACIIAAVIFGIFMIRMIKWNMLNDKSNAVRMNPSKFSFKVLPIYFGMCWVAYFFLNHAPLVVLPYSEFTSLSKTAYMLTSSEHFETALMFVTGLLIAIFYIPASKKLKSRQA